MNIEICGISCYCFHCVCMLLLSLLYVLYHSDKIYYLICSVVFLPLFVSSCRLSYSISVHYLICPCSYPFLLYMFRFIIFGLSFLCFRYYPPFQTYGNTSIRHRPQYCSRPSPVQPQLSPATPQGFGVHPQWSPGRSQGFPAQPQGSPQIARVSSMTTRVCTKSPKVSSITPRTSSTTPKVSSTIPRVSSTTPVSFLLKTIVFKLWTKS